MNLNSSTTQTYIVQSGDSLYKIANKFSITVDALKTTNNLTSDLIYIGQSLQIPAPTLPVGIFRIGSSGPQVKHCKMFWFPLALVYKLMEFMGLKLLV